MATIKNEETKDTVLSGTINKVPYHIHNGSDTPKIPASSIEGSLGETFVDVGQTTSARALTADGSWNDLDISGDIPSTAKMILIQVNHTGGTVGDTIRIRDKTNTTALFRCVNRVSAVTEFVDGILAVYGTTIEYNAETGFTISTLKVKGYWI